jgi:hypothetical protein
VPRVARAGGAGRGGGAGGGRGIGSDPMRWDIDKDVTNTCARGCARSCVVRRVCAQAGSRTGSLRAHERRIASSVCSEPTRATRQHHAAAVMAAVDAAAHLDLLLLSGGWLLARPADPPRHSSPQRPARVLLLPRAGLDAAQRPVASPIVGRVGMCAGEKATLRGIQDGSSGRMRVPAAAPQRRSHSNTWYTRSDSNAGQPLPSHR